MKRFVLLNLLAFAAALSLASHAYASGAAALRCESVFVDDTQDISYIYQAPKSVEEQITSTKFQSTKLMSSLRGKSKVLFAQLSSKKAVIELDFLCIGAGPACISAVHALPAKSRANALIVEQSNQVAKTFADADFFINTGTATTDIPGVRSPFSDFTKDMKYPHSSQLAMYLQKALADSQVSVLLNSKVTAIEYQVSDKSVFLKTANGLVFKVKNLLLGTGLGEGSTKVSDPVYQALFAQSKVAFENNFAEFQPVMHSDAFLAALRNISEKSSAKNATSLLPKKIFIFGNGDGARISLEALSRLKLPPQFKVIWVGAPYKNAAEYIASQDGFDRYVQAIPSLYNKNHIQGYAGHVQSVAAGHDGFAVTVKADDKMLVLPESADMIIDATGYQPSALLKQMQSAETVLTSIPVVGPADVFNSTTLGQQVVINGNPTPIYQIGLAAGFLIKPDEKSQRQIQNPAAIHNNAGRAYSLVKKVLVAE